MLKDLKPENDETEALGVAADAVYLGVAVVIRHLVRDGRVGHTAAVLHPQGTGGEQDGRNDDEGNQPFESLQGKAPFSVVGSV